MLIKLNTFEVEVLAGHSVYARVPYVGEVYYSKAEGLVFDSWKTLQDMKTKRQEEAR